MLLLIGCLLAAARLAWPAAVQASAGAPGAAAPAVAYGSQWDGTAPPTPTGPAARARWSAEQTRRLRFRASRPISGSSVTAIGDSILVASTPALNQELPGISIDAQVGRQFATGLQVLAALRQQGLVRHIVVFALGTNGPVTQAEISQLYALIGPQRRLVLVNTYAARFWEPEVNAILSATASGNAATTILADWYDAVGSRPYLLWSDGIHPLPAGTIVYARMLKAAIERAANLPG